MPSVFGVRPPATSRCVPSIAPRPVCRRTDSPDRPSTRSTAVRGQDLDPLVPEEPLDRLGDVRVLAVDQRAVPLDDGHAAAEAAERLRQLEAHVAAAQDDQVFRELVQLQGLDVGQRASLREAGGVVDPGTRPGVDDDGLAAERPGPARVERDLDRLRRDEAPVAHDELRAALPVLRQVHLDQSVDHLPLAVADGGHVDLPVAAGDPELGAAAEIVGDLGAVDDVLARQAGDVGARPADIPPLDDRRALPLRGQRPGQELAGRPAAQDDHVVFLGLRHVFLLRVNPTGSRRPSIITDPA